MEPPKSPLIIDRFEGDYAVCEAEGGSFHHIPRHMLPPGVREGDVLISSGGVSAGGVYAIDHTETQRRRAEAIALQNKLFK